MTRDEARRIARDPSADPILRYDARVLLGEIERPLPKFARERQLDTVSPEPDWSRWNAWCDERIRSALAKHQRFIFDTVGTALGEYVGNQLQAAKREFEDELRQLKIELEQTQSLNAELRSALAADRGVVDLPNPLHVRIN